MNRTRRALVVLVACAATSLGAGGWAGQQLAFEDVVARLEVGDPRGRLESLRLLRDAGYLEAAVPVAALLTDPIAEVRVQAIETEVSLFLADEDYTRKYAAAIVGQRGATLPLLAFAQGPGALIASPVPREVVSGLIGATASSEASVRFNAIYALGVFAPAVLAKGPLPDADVAVERLMAAVRTPDPTLRLAATHVLGRLFEATASTNGRAGLLPVRSEVGDQLVAGMNDADPLVRSASIRAIGAMHYERAVQALTDQLAYYKKGDQARELLDALAWIAHPSSLGAFSSLLDHDDEQMRRLAVVGIGRVGDGSALDSLEIRMARDRSKFVKQALAYVRARRGDSPALAQLMEGFRDRRLGPVAWTYLVDLGPAVGADLGSFALHRDWRVRAATAEALGVIGHEPSVVVVEGLTRDKNRNVASAARRSLQRLTPRPPGAPRLP
ncbi:MAG: HEAT repeat domain-containing protein [Acidobacteriota bacterium]